MVTLNLALGHRMEGFAPDMANIELCEIACQFVRDIRRAIIGQQAWSSSTLTCVIPVLAKARSRVSCTSLAAMPAVSFQAIDGSCSHHMRKAN